MDDGKKKRDILDCRQGFSAYVARGERRIHDLRNRLERTTLGSKMWHLPWDTYSSKGDESWCVLRRLAKEEKLLREAIYNVERTEKSGLAIVSPSSSSSSSSSSFSSLKRVKNETAKTSCSITESEISKRISRLEACGKKLCTNLRRRRKDRDALIQEAEILSRELEQTRKKLGLNERSRETERKPEDDSSNKDDPMDGTTRINNLKKMNAFCPCGNPSECDDCTLCSCFEWEKDLYAEKVEENISKLKEIRSKSEIVSTECLCRCYESHLKSEYEFTCCSSSSFCCSSSVSSSIHTSFGSLVNAENAHRENCESQRERHREGVNSVKSRDASKGVISNPSACLSLTKSDQTCQVEKLQKGLELLKNHSHVMKKLLRESREERTSSKAKMDDDLLAKIKILERKCHAKDCMIVALVDELKLTASPERTHRVLPNLTKSSDSELHRRADDFDRSIHGKIDLFVLSFLIALYTIRSYILKEERKMSLFPWTCILSPAYELYQEFYQSFLFRTGLFVAQISAVVLQYVLLLVTPGFRNFNTSINLVYHFAKILYKSPTIVIDINRLLLLFAIGATIIVITIATNTFDTWKKHLSNFVVSSSLTLRRINRFSWFLYISYFFLGYITSKFIDISLDTRSRFFLPDT